MYLVHHQELKSTAFVCVCVCVEGGWGKQKVFQMCVTCSFIHFAFVSQELLQSCTVLNNEKVYVLLSLFSLCTTKYLGSYSNKCTQFYFVECPMA